MGVNGAGWGPPVFRELVSGREPLHLQEFASGSGVIASSVKQVRLSTRAACRTHAWGRKTMWNQIYDPLHSPVLSTIAAAVPVVTLLVLIASGRVQAHIAAIIAVIVTNLITIFVFTMPANMSIRASVLGIVTGFFPIGWIVLNVIFLYQVTVTTGRFELLKRAVGGVTEDRRLQLLLIAFSFGAFFEGASGFGTPVAITGSVLIGLG